MSKLQAGCCLTEAVERHGVATFEFLVLWLLQLEQGRSFLLLEVELGRLERECR